MKKKIKLIDNLYATERLKETDYYKKILDTLNYLKAYIQMKWTKQRLKNV